MESGSQDWIIALEIQETHRERDDSINAATLRLADAPLAFKNLLWTSWWRADTARRHAHRERTQHSDRLSLTHRGHVSHRMPGRTGGPAISAPRLKQNEGHVFYLAFGYFISYQPYALLAKALSSGIIHTPGASMTGADAAHAVLQEAGVADRTHWPADSDISEPSATSRGDHRRTGVLIQHAGRMRPAEQFP